MFPFSKARQCPAAQLLLVIFAQAIPFVRVDAQVKRDTAVAVGWASLYVDHRNGLRSGSDILVKVHELGALCYETDIRITQNGAAAATGKLVSILQKETDLPGDIVGLAESSKEKGRESDSSATKTEPVEEFMIQFRRGIRTETVAIKAVPTLPDRISRIAEGVRKNVTERVDTGVSQQERAEAILKAISKRQDSASSGLNQFYGSACPSGERGGADGADAQKLWQPAQSALEAVAADSLEIRKASQLLDSAEKNLAAARARLEDIAASLDDDDIAYRGSDGWKSVLRRDKPLAEQTAKLVTTSKARLEAMNKIRKTLVETLAGVQALLEADDETLLPIHIRNGTEELILVISATGRANIPTTKGKKFEDKVTLPVLRRRRYFESVGPAILVGGSFPRYVLVNQRDPDDPAKTQSAYADRNGGHWYTVAPALFGHVSVHDWDDEKAVLGTLGIGTRSTAGGLRPDFFFGLSLGLGDLFVVTGGISFGWREELMDDALLTGPVPTEITPESAIRTRIKPSLAFALSFRP